VKTGDAADLAQARWFQQIIDNHAQDQLAALVEADRKKTGPPPGMPIGEDDWFGEPTAGF
jgi:hypothetical protein